MYASKVGVMWAAVLNCRDCRTLKQSLGALQADTGTFSIYRQVGLKSRIKDLFCMTAVGIERIYQVLPSPDVAWDKSLHCHDLGHCK